MLRIHVPANSAAAKAYYSKAGDYYGYGSGGEYAGAWQGKLAEELGLSGAATMEDFHALCDNRHPRTGKRLTGCDRDDRRPLIDFMWSVPKSVPLMRSLVGDDRIEQAIWDTVTQTMGDIEAEIATRVRKNGAFHNRIVGNGVILPFYHRFSRPVNGEADPGDHIHACLVNVCRDSVEDQLKAVEIGHIKANAPYWQAVWHARLANRLHELGYDIRATKAAFEISGVSADLIKRFSRRTDLIERKAEALGIIDADEKAKLGATTREAKSDALTPEQLHARWLERLKPGELDQLKLIYAESRPNAGRETIDGNAAALDWALKHLLERQSVVEEGKLLTQALKHGVGRISVEALKRELERPDLVRATVDGRKLISTREVLAEEWSVLRFAQAGRGRRDPVLSGSGVRAWEKDIERGADKLSSEQYRFAKHFLRSRDAITLGHGKAGTGKTRSVRAVVRGLEASSTPYLVLAPSAEASRGVLRREGFAEATTLAEFLRSETLQEHVRGGVVILDEAGLAGFKDMAATVKLADSLGARLFLIGDRRQHRSVARGEPLAVLEDQAGLKPAELTEIRRQEPNDYKQAVELLAAGRAVEGFDKLNAMGAVKLMPVWDKYEPMVSDYMQALKDEKSVLVLSPTHKEGAAITSVLRERLKQDGRLARDDKAFSRLVPLNLTEAERQDAVNYAPGMIVQFYEHSGQYRAGQRVTVTEENANDLAKRATATQVYAEASIPMAKGEAIRITGPGKDKSGTHRLTNGSLYHVSGFTRMGEPVLNNGWVLGKEFGHWSPGYVLTSFAGQGKTVQRLLVAVSSQSYPAANARQFYVDASRGKESCTIYTDCPDSLRQAAKRDEPRTHALDLVKAAAKKMTWRQRLKKHLERFSRIGAIRQTGEHPDRRLELSREQEIGYGY